MFAYICFKNAEKQKLIEKIKCLFCPPEYIQSVDFLEYKDCYYQVSIPIEKDERPNKTIKKIQKATNWLIAKNIHKVIIAKDCAFVAEILDSGLELYDASGFFQKNIINMIRFIAKRSNRENNQSVCVVNDTDFEHTTLDFLEKLAEACHTVGTVSQEKESTQQILDEFYEQTGVPVLLSNGIDMIKSAHYIISFCDTDKILAQNLNRRAIVICAEKFWKPKTSYHNQVITGFVPKLPQQVKLNADYHSQMEILGAIVQYYHANFILEYQIAHIIDSDNHIAGAIV